MEQKRKSIQDSYQKIKEIKGYFKKVYQDHF